MTFFVAPLSISFSWIFILLVCELYMVYILSVPQRKSNRISAYLLVFCSSYCTDPVFCIRKLIGVVSILMSEMMPLITVLLCVLFIIINQQHSLWLIKLFNSNLSQKIPICTIMQSVNEPLQYNHLLLLFFTGELQEVRPQWLNIDIMRCI